MASNAYAIVEFIPANGVAIVPITWLNLEEDHCLWPPKKASANIAQINSIVKNLEPPQQSWKKFGVTDSQCLEKQVRMHILKILFCICYAAPLCQCLFF